MPEQLPDHAVRNRAVWTAANAQYTDGRARESWTRDDIRWGVFKAREEDIRILPDVHGLDVVELGCCGPMAS